jgi:hypothetical protein
MKLPLASEQTFTQYHGGEAGASRAVLLALLCFVAGASLSAAWFYSHKSKPDNAATATPDVRLSPATLEALGALKEPLEVRFYSLLDTKTVERSLADFAGRIDRVLTAFERHAEG